MEMRRGNAPKHIGRTLVTTSVPGQPTSRLLHIHDPTNHLTFLIDTGAVVSVLAPTGNSLNHIST